MAPSFHQCFLNQIIGAIGVPLSGVTGFAFSNYLTSRRRDNE
jgi:hypothetical protein